MKDRNGFLRQMNSKHRFFPSNRTIWKDSIVSLYLVNVWMRACHRKYAHIHRKCLLFAADVALERTHANDESNSKRAGERELNDCCSHGLSMSYYDYGNYLAVSATDQLDRVVNLLSFVQYLMKTTMFDNEWHKNTRCWRYLVAILSSTRQYCWVWQMQAWHSLFIAMRNTFTTNGYWNFSTNRRFKWTFSLTRINCVF